jgi:erythrin-vacuolar iron transport family protein
VIDRDPATPRVGDSQETARGSGRADSGQDGGRPEAALAGTPGGPAGTGGERGSSRVTHAIARLTGFDDRSFILRVVQPALVGMIDGTVSTLAPIFAAAISSSSHTALVVGIATALGAGVSMGFSEALSDTGEETGRGSAIVRGAITGLATAVGGVFHSLPFIIHDVHTALIVAGVVVGIELFTIAWVRHRFLKVPLRNSFVMVTLGGAIVVLIGVVIGSS